MPVEIDLGNAPAGYTLTAARPEEIVEVQFLEFTSSEDGQHFIQRLEGLPSDILNRIYPRIVPSQIDHMLVILRRGGTATAYINELSIRVRMRASKRVEAGEHVFKNDIIDIDRLELSVDIPDDAGFLFVFSVGWRKGLFYDFGPIGTPSCQRREFDVQEVFGQAYCHVLFQERFSISDEEWDALFAAKWFPFSGLCNDSIDALINHVRIGWDPDDKIDDFVSEISSRASQMIEAWQNNSSFTPHMPILERAVERFLDEDFVSCTGLVFPRIEGILRTHHTSLGVSGQASCSNLTNTAVASKIKNEKCLLLPHRFAAYLRDIYFASFNPIDQDIDVSRHSVAHGVANASEFNKKSALLGLLVVHQLFYFLKSDRAEGLSDDSPSNVPPAE